MRVPARLPVLVFDGDCGFCTSSARFLVRWVIRGRSVSLGPSIEPWQRLDLARLGLTPGQCQTAVQWVGEDGDVASGHKAIAEVLRSGLPVWRPIGALLVAPGFGWLAGRLYAWISEHRYALPGGNTACRNDGPDQGV
jgi:predicted DCC family thiol-disulfide oxidoreductase YuxK